METTDAPPVAPSEPPPRRGTGWKAFFILLAASLGGGVIEANRAGGTVKRLHCGFAAQAGLTAALLAEQGYTGPPTVLEGRFGFYRAFVGERFDAAAVVGGLGERWELPGIFFKPYPANHYTHAGIDAALAIRRKPSFDPLFGSSMMTIRLKPVSLSGENAFSSCRMGA